MTLHTMGGRKLTLLFSVALLVSLLKFLWLAGYAHPVADDFCYAAKSHDMGLWQWSLGEWMSWNGRYASNLLMVHGPLAWSTNFLPGYRAVPILLMALTFLGYWLLLRKLCGRGFSGGQTALGALALLVLYLNLMPDLGEGFFWYTGAVTYQLGSILLLFHLGLLAGKPKGGWTSALIFLLNLLLAAVITGMDEIHMLLIVALHLARTAWLLWNKQKGILLEVVLLAGVVAGALLMYLAPGNAVRGAMFADTHELFRSLGMSALQAVRFIATWLLSPALLAFSVLYIPLHRGLMQQVPGMRKLLRMPWWIAALLPFLLVAATTFPAYWSTGLLGQHRTINVACFFFIPLAWLNLAIWLERAPLRRLARWDPSPVQHATAMVLVLVALNATGNGYAANADLLGGRARAYDRVMTARERQLREAAADPTTRVIFIHQDLPPRTLPSYEGQYRLRDWMMQCQARFFHADPDQVDLAGD